MRSYWIRLGLIHDWYSYKMEGNLDTKTQRHTERTPCDDRGRDRSEVSIRQGMSRIAGNHQKLEEGTELILTQSLQNKPTLLIPDF